MHETLSTVHTLNEGKLQRNQTEKRKKKMKYLLLVMLINGESREAIDLDAVLRRAGIANSS